jgi:hypothetical protein
MPEAHSRLLAAADVPANGVERVLAFPLRSVLAAPNIFPASSWKQRVGGATTVQSTTAGLAARRHLTAGAGGGKEAAKRLRGSLGPTHSSALPCIALQAVVLFCPRTGTSLPATISVSASCDGGGYNSRPQRKP